MVLLLVLSFMGGAACKAEPVQNTGITPEATPTEQVKQETTMAPEENEVIDEVKEEEIKENEAEEEVVRTAVITLSDNGIVVDGAGCTVEGSCLKIKEAGVFEIAGTLSDGSICVNADKESEVQLILNGVTVHNETSAALFCKKASKVTLTLAEGSENMLTDGADYVFEEGEDEPDATLFSKQDLIINGEGKLTVTAAYGDAIKGKDSLYIMGGSLVVGGVEDGIIGKDLLHIGGGEVSVNVVKDALKSTNDTDETLGNIVIEGGSVFLMAGEDGVQAEGTVSVKGGDITVSAGDDGIHAERAIHIDGDAKVSVTKSAEGIEAPEVVIDGGVIDVNATDDGINAAGDDGTGETVRNPFAEGIGEIVINGGSLTVNAGGDGLDANGNITMNGGTVVVFGPTGGGNGVLDFGGMFCVNGGTLFAVGSSEMAQTPADMSGQASLAVVPESVVQAGSVLTVSVDGQSVIEKEVPKRVNYVVVSSVEMKEGATVTVTVDGEVICQKTLAEKVTIVGKLIGMGGFGNKDGFGGRPGGGRPDMQNGEMPQMPEGGRMPRPERGDGEMPQIPEWGDSSMPAPDWSMDELPQMPEGGMMPPPDWDGVLPQVPTEGQDA